MLNSLCTILLPIFIILALCNGYTMGCPPVRGENPRALASGLSYVHMDYDGLAILYQLYHTSVDLTHHEIFRARGWGGNLRAILVRVCGPVILNLPQS